MHLPHSLVRFGIVVALISASAICGGWKWETLSF
jgi:hypothetical protein